MRRRPEPRRKSSSSRQSGTASRWILRPACGLSSAWPTEGESEMRKLAAIILGLISSGLGTTATAAAATPADQPRTMDDVVDRLVLNENHLHQEIRKYAPLIETYIQNLKHEKQLGFAPPG